MFCWLDRDDHDYIWSWMLKFNLTAQFSCLSLTANDRTLPACNCCEQRGHAVLLRKNERERMWDKKEDENQVTRRQDKGWNTLQKVTMEKWLSLSLKTAGKEAQLSTVPKFPERGIDHVWLLNIDKSVAKCLLTESETNPDNELFQGSLNNVRLYLFFFHWPSKVCSF